MRVASLSIWSRKKILVTIRKSLSFKLSYKIKKLIKEQTIESLIDESIEWNQQNEPFLKLLSIFMLAVFRGINYNVIEAKIKEIAIRMILHYLIHEGVLSLKHCIESI